MHVDHHAALDRCGALSARFVAHLGAPSPLKISADQPSTSAVNSVLASWVRDLADEQVAGDDLGADAHDADGSSRLRQRLLRAVGDCRA